MLMVSATPDCTRRPLPLAVWIAAMWLAVAMLTPSAAGQPADVFERARSITDDSLFAHPRAVLMRLAAQRGTTRLNEFCIIGQDLGNGDRQAWVYWKQQDALILWEPQVGSDIDLTTSRRYLDLKRDMAMDVGSSSYKVTTRWVDSLRAACSAQGLQLTIEKN